MARSYNVIIIGLAIDTAVTKVFAQEQRRYEKTTMRADYVANTTGLQNKKNGIVLSTLGDKMTVYAHKKQSVQYAKYPQYTVERVEPTSWDVFASEDSEFRRNDNDKSAVLYDLCGNIMESPWPKFFRIRRVQIINGVLVCECGLFIQELRLCGHQLAVKNGVIDAADIHLKWRSLWQSGHIPYEAFPRSAVDGAGGPSIKGIDLDAPLGTLSLKL